MNVDERLRNVDQASHLAHVSLALMQRLSWRCSLDEQAFHDADTDTDTDSDILADYRLYVLSELYLISFLFNDFCISVISGYTAKMVCISSQTTDLALKGHCHGNPFSGKKLANQPSFGSMAF